MCAPGAVACQSSWYCHRIQGSWTSLLGSCSLYGPWAHSPRTSGSSSGLGIVYHGFRTDSSNDGPGSRTWAAFDSLLPGLGTWIPADWASLDTTYESYLAGRWTATGSSCQNIACGIGWHTWSIWCTNTKNTRQDSPPRTCTWGTPSSSQFRSLKGWKWIDLPAAKHWQNWDQHWWGRVSVLAVPLRYCCRLCSGGLRWSAAAGY